MSLNLLSKSDFMNFRKCPEAFWYSKYDPDKLDQKSLTTFAQQIIEQGKEVEVWARKLFPSGVFVPGTGEKAISTTLERIKKGCKEIFQATFSDGELYAMADIIVWNEKLNGWDIYEVKGSSSREGGAKKSDHYWDLAFQRETFNRAGVKSANLFLIEVNSDFYKDGRINPSDLLKVSNVTEEIDSMSIEIKQAIAAA